MISPYASAAQSNPAWLSPTPRCLLRTCPLCSECYEVRCRNTNFRDGYGDSLKRENACYSEDETVIVKIVDA